MKPTPWLKKFNREADALLADMERTEFQIRAMNAEIRARERGFTGLADALRVVWVAHQYGLTMDDARTFIEEQEQIARDEAKSQEFTTDIADPVEAPV